MAAEKPARPETLRLNQYIARSGAASRRHAEEFIRQGRVQVNGSVITELATLVLPGKDVVKLDGARLKLPQHSSFYALYKPKEVVSTLDDPQGRPCLRAYLPPGARGLVPVGRLDYHSEGLILLTNDGDLTFRLLHPRFKVQKVYHLKVKGAPDPASLEKLKHGIVIEGKRTLPIEIKKVPSRETKHTWLEVKMSEGRKNQLREMFFRIEHPVIKLKRVAMGPLLVGALKPGQWRELERQEAEALRAAAGLGAGAGGEKT